MTDRYILSLNISHNSSAAVMLDGRIVAATQEERFSRKKNHVGYPHQAVEFCLDWCGITGTDLSTVAYTSIESSGLFTKASITTEFTLRDYIDYYGERYYERLFAGREVSEYLEWVDTAPQFNRHPRYFDYEYLTPGVREDRLLDVELFREAQRSRVETHLGYPAERVQFLDHHTCHAYYAYFGSPFRRKDCLVVTLDGWGDGRNMAVWMARDDSLEMIGESGENDLGRVYKFATLILGMRPDMDEYKVMGLAPYAKSEGVAAAAAVLDGLSEVREMRIVHRDRPQDLYGHLAEGWKDHRFDNIAGAAQLYTERLATELIADVVATTGVRRIVVSGGISMNVKMNQAIAEMDEVEEMFVCGSGGDESLSIGGCYVLNEGHSPNRPLRDLSLGYDVAADIDDLDLEDLEKRHDVSTVCDPATVARLLASGEIVAILRGRTEFGARALGNRSILADPGRRDCVRRINEAIKNRDFWMPFALSILETFQDQYICNPKGIEAPFMTMTFDTRAAEYERIAAGTHPYDRTVRPQIVSRGTTPEYFELIDEFRKLTGTAAVLNTSFNLHGEPIVNDVRDAIRTFERSDLDHLWIDGSILISARRR